MFTSAQIEVHLWGPRKKKSHLYWVDLHEMAGEGRHLAPGGAEFCERATEIVHLVDGQRLICDEMRWPGGLS